MKLWVRMLGDASPVTGPTFPVIGSNYSGRWLKILVHHQSSAVGV